MKKKDFSNKLAYILIALSCIILLGIGVYAYGTSNPPVMGHSLGELGLPSCSLAGQALTWNGNSWVCTNPSITDTKFTINANGKLCYITPVPTCKLTNKTCSNFTFVVDAYYYNCAYTNLATLTNYCLNTICKNPPFYQIPCNGDTTSCSGGTSVQYNRVTSIGCGGVHKLFCYCSSTQYYLEEGYTPTGTERCI